MKLAKFALLCCSILCVSLFGTNTGSATIDPENNIRIVLMGPTGAGKSTTINAFFSHTHELEWQQYPKSFAIPAKFQPCNVAAYAQRNVENIASTLDSATQDPSEYVAKGQHFVVHLIDTPGAADTRGKLQDIQNSNKIEEFLEKVGRFHVIGVVLPATISRASEDEIYMIQQIMSSIPKTAHNRIVLLITHSKSINRRVLDFAEFVGLPANQVYAFNHYALTEEGHVDISDVDINAGVKTTAVNRNPFAPVATTESTEILEKREIAKTIKDTWEKSAEEFYRLLRDAKSLGSYTSEKMKDIRQTKSQVHERILTQHNEIRALKEREPELQNARIALKFAQDAFDKSLENMSAAEKAEATALKAKQDAELMECYSYYDSREEEKTNEINTVCLLCNEACHAPCGLKDMGHDEFQHLSGCNCISGENCTSCKNRCSFTLHRHRKHIWKTVRKSIPIESKVKEKATAIAGYNECAGRLNTTKTDVHNKTVDKNSKNSAVDEMNRLLSGLRHRIKDLQCEIVDLYVDLGQHSMSSPVFHINGYFDTLVRGENDQAKIANLNRERQAIIAAVNERIQNPNVR